MARCSPQDKLTLVRRLKEMGEVRLPAHAAHPAPRRLRPPTRPRTTTPPYAFPALVRA